MEIYSLYSVESTESQENKKNPEAKYYLQWVWKSGTSAIPGMHVSPELILHLLVSRRHLDPHIVMLYWL